MPTHNPRVRALPALLALLAAPLAAASLPPRLLADFEGADYGDWTATGTAFRTGPSTGPQYAQRLSGFAGKGLVNTFTNKKDTETGTLTSPPFTISHRQIHFLVAGGKHPGKTAVLLLVDGKALRSATGDNHDRLEWHTWDLSPFHGKEARIRIVDQVSGPWGHIDVDHILLSDGPPPAQLSRRGLPAMDPQFHSTFRYTPHIGLGPEKGITRRDPSDVIRVGDLYYVWYTRTPRGPSGYDATVWYATSPDGLQWTERAEAIPRGAPGQWDDRSVFTPNILVSGGRYYLFYTAVANPFDERTHTAIGLASADSPDGPWQKAHHNPVLATGQHGTWASGTETAATERGAWDSHRVDDACLITRKGRYWLYYKGRQMGLSPAHTKMGVAIAAAPEGPYVKHEANPVIRGGHEVLVWPHGEGVASLLTAAGAPSVWYAPDGIHFERKAPVRDVPHAPGAFRPDAFSDTRCGQGILWGISHRSERGQMPWLVRFDCRLAPEPSTPE